MSTDRETALYAKALEQRDAALKALRPFAETGRDLRPKAAVFRVLGEGKYAGLPLEAWLRAAELLYPEKKP